MTSRYIVVPSNDGGYYVLSVEDGKSRGYNWFPGELRAHHEANDRNRALSLREANARKLACDERANERPVLTIW